MKATAGRFREWKGGKGKEEREGAQKGWSAMEALGTGTVFAQGYCCMFGEDEKETLPLSVISPNFSQRGRRGQVALAVV